MSPTRRALWALLFGLFTALPLAVAFGLLERTLGVPSPSEAIFVQVASRLPGALVTAAIEGLVALLGALDVGPTARAAKEVEHLLAVALFAGGASLFAAVAAVLTRAHLLVGFAVAGLIAAVVSLAFVMADPSASAPAPAAAAISLLGWEAWAIVVALAVGHMERISRRRETEPRVAAASRRRFILGFAASSLAVTGLLSVLSRAAARLPGGGVAGAPLEGAPPPARPRTAFVPAPGTRPEITPVEDFYRVDINLTPPAVDREPWRLVVDGLVERPLSLRYEDVLALEPEHVVITQECISNPVGGDLISTQQISGVPLARVLERAGMDPRAGACNFTCADGYTESLPMRSVLDERTLLVYGIGGVALPAEHGYPLRLFTPDRFGMKNPKWLTRVEVALEERPGYWERRGWSQRAQVRITSVVDTQGRLTPMHGKVALGGIAYAGARGISRVEVQVDDGPFTEAALAPPLSPLSWVLWRQEVKLSPGAHRVRVRAWDGAGRPQIAEPTDPHPAGATGLHSVVVEV